MGVSGRVTTFLAMDKHQEGATKIVAFQKTGKFLEGAFVGILLFQFPVLQTFEAVALSGKQGQPD